jgi:hypothetical protein
MPSGQTGLFSWPIDRIEQSISPTAEQRTGLDEFADAMIRASALSRSVIRAVRTSRQAFELR